MASGYLVNCCNLKLFPDQHQYAKVDVDKDMSYKYKSGK
jgi:hypothetical protein